MKKFILLALALFTIFHSTNSAALYWKGGVSGNWLTSLLNWLTTQGGIPSLNFPSAGDDIYITASGDYTVTFDLASLLQFKSVVIGSATGTGKQVLRLTKNMAIQTTLTLEKTGQILLDDGSQITGGSIVLNGQLTVQGSGLKKITSQITNNGIFEILGGNVEVESNYVQRNPDSILSCTSGNLTVAANGELKVINGTVKGTGSINASKFVSGGTLNPGNSPGTFYVNGDFEAPINSITYFEVDANTNDRLIIRGKAAVYGAVSFKSIGSYAWVNGRELKAFLVFSSHDYKPFGNFIVGEGFFNKKPTLTIGTASIDMKVDPVIGSNANRPVVGFALIVIFASLLIIF